MIIPNYREGKTSKAGQRRSPRWDRKVPQGAWASVPWVWGQAHGISRKCCCQNWAGYQDAHWRDEPGCAITEGQCNKHVFVIMKLLHCHFVTGAGWGARFVVWHQTWTSQEQQRCIKSFMFIWCSCKYVHSMCKYINSW